MGGKKIDLEEIRKPRRYAPAFYHAFFFVLAANP